ESLSKDNEPVEALSKDDESVEALSKDDEPVESVSKADDLVEDVGKDDEPEEALSKDDEPVEAVSKGGDLVEAVSKDDKPRGAVSKDEPMEAGTKHDKPVEAVSKDNEPVEALSKEDEPLEVVSKDDEYVNAVNKDYEYVNAVNKNDEPIQSVSKDDELVEDVSKDDKPVEAFSKDDEPVEAVNKDYEHMDAVNKDDESIQPVSKDDEPVEALSKDNEPTVSKDDKPVEPSSKDIEPVEVVSKDDEPMEVLSNDDEPLKDVTKDYEHVDALNKDDESVGAVTKDYEQVQSVNKDDEPVGAMCKFDELVEAVTKAYDHVDAVNNDGKPAQAVSKDDQPVEAVNKVDEPIEIVSKDNEPVEAMCKFVKPLVISKYIDLVNEKKEMNTGSKGVKETGSLTQRSPKDQETLSITILEEPVPDDLSSTNVSKVIPNIGLMCIKEEPQFWYSEYQTSEEHKPAETHETFQQQDFVDKAFTTQFRSRKTDSTLPISENRETSKTKKPRLKSFQHKYSSLNKIRECLAPIAKQHKRKLSQDSSAESSCDSSSENSSVANDSPKKHRTLYEAYTEERENKSKQHIDLPDVHFIGKKQTETLKNPLSVRNQIPNVNIFDPTSPLVSPRNVSTEEIDHTYSILPMEKQICSTHGIPNVSNFKQNEGEKQMDFNQSNDSKDTISSRDIQALKDSNVSPESSKKKVGKVRTALLNLNDNFRNCDGDDAINDMIVSDDVLQVKDIGETRIVNQPKPYEIQPNKRKIEEGLLAIKKA
ncbi:unnamed protein product, partial [Owenia fusiformis]